MNTCATCKHWRRMERQESMTAYLREDIYGKQFPVHYPAFRESYGRCSYVCTDAARLAWILDDDEDGGKLWTQEVFGCNQWEPK